MSTGPTYDSSSPDLFIEYKNDFEESPPVNWRHYHDNYEIYFFTGRQMTYFINNENFTLHNYDIALIDQYTFHKTSYLNNAKKERILINFRPIIFENSCEDFMLTPSYELFKRYKKISLVEDEKPKIESIIYKMLDSYNSKTKLGFAMSKLLLAELLLTFLKADAENNIIDHNSRLTDNEMKVSEIIHYINKNYQEDILLDNLSSEFYINKYYLCHIFKEVSGLSVIDFFNRKRLAEAERLIKYSNYNILQISTMVGFNSINHFINLFKKTYHTTPKKFRSNFRNPTHDSSSLL